jgi:hypothetical protein
MADKRADGRSGDDRRITRRGAIGTGIASVGLGALWASPLASASANGPRVASGGKVTVFNCYNEPVHRLTIDGDDVGNIAQWSEGGANRPAKYTPASLTVPRSKNPEPKSFAIGNNRLSAVWNSFTGTATIKIPDPNEVSLMDDLLLFLAINEATMMSTRGYVIARFSVDRQFDR